MIPAQTEGCKNTAAKPGAAIREVAIADMSGRSPLAQLLHALNQPLTGLQCGMEVALARPRTPEQYAAGLRQGLELTERMRALVEAIREVADGLDENDDAKAQNGEWGTTELSAILLATVEDLKPVAESKSVSLVLECSSSLAVKAEPRRLTGVVFRLLESALSAAAGGSQVRIEGSAADGEWLRVCWEADAPRSALSRPELGLLVAQAGFERSGARWERTRTGKQETLTIRLPRTPRGSRSF